MESLLYPKSPASVPKNLTSLTSSYQFKAFLAVLAILLFFALYAGLVVALGFLAYHAFTYEMGRINKLTILLKVGAIAGSVMLFVFTLKFIFKLENPKRTNRLKLGKDEYPELWSFVHQICKETGAPKPKNIYADPDVNAYVAYSNMWLSLFLPVKKELTIGLGLVSCLNLSEFKAVISHEFGHFAQRSMKIGSYIVSANTIIHDMIFSRDKWDDLLDQWRSSDLRLSAAAWIITPIIWLIRQILNLFYQFLNVMYSSLSREMEFNADKVAISTSGSDAILAALWQLDHGHTNWNDTVNHAYLASQKQIAVENLYHHNELAKNRVADTIKESFSLLPADQRGGVQFFSESEHSKAGMYASHPANDKRQNNAKSPYVLCETDTRSAWLLFPKKEELQKSMTTLVYDQYLNKKDMKLTSSIADFEAFIVSETKGKELLQSYENTFENRFVTIPSSEELENSSSAQLKASAYQKMKGELKNLMQPIASIEKIMAEANQIASGTTKINSFAFKGVTYSKKNLQEGYEKLHSERQNLLNESFKDWDTSYFQFHYHLAKVNGREQELLKIYRQHTQFVDLYKQAAGVKSSIYTELNDLQSKEVTEQDVRRFGYHVNDLVLSLNDFLLKFEDSSFVPLPNIETVEELRNAIIDNGEFKRQSGNIFENGGFHILLENVDKCIASCQRIDQKSIATILEYHTELHESLQS